MVTEVLSREDFTDRYFDQVFLWNRYFGFSRIWTHEVGIDCADASPEKVAEFFRQQPQRTNANYLKTVQALNEEKEFLSKMEERFGVSIVVTGSSYKKCLNGTSSFLRAVRLHTALLAAESCLTSKVILVADRFQRPDPETFWVDGCAQPKDIHAHLCSKTVPNNAVQDRLDEFEQRIRKLESRK